MREVCCRCGRFAAGMSAIETEAFRKQAQADVHSLSTTRARHYRDVRPEIQYLFPRIALLPIPKFE